MTDIEVMARTLWGEDRAGGCDGMEAVAAVVMNRYRSPVRWWKIDVPGYADGTVGAVCRKPYQFSCWLSNDPNRAKLLAVTTEDEAYSLALEIANEAVDGKLTDPTHGATYYHADTVKMLPSWAKDRSPCARTGGNVFYNI